MESGCIVVLTYRIWVMLSKGRVHISFPKPELATIQNG
jgi:hypothetical protein